MKRPPIFALIDCNNFFASCEKLFRPDLEGRPVVVLSSNDGCVVARSNEAKALGIPMAAPAFKYRQLFARHKVVQFSANFELYGNVSRRITELLATITPRLEVYSVDEAFLDLSQLPITDYAAWGREVRQAILDWIGVPVSIGIAPSKTLAKLASDIAKKQPQYQGCLSLLSAAERRTHLAQFPLNDIWGIGWRLAPRLRAVGVASAADVAAMRPQLAQQLMGIQGRQLVAELNGVCCYRLELEGKPPKSISATRTFGEDTADFSLVEAAIASFAARASFKLRHSGQLTRHAALFITTNKHKPGYQRWSQDLYFPIPTADTGQLAHQLVAALQDVYQPHQLYHRAGVLLYDFVPEHLLQTDLLGEVDTTLHDRTVARLRAMDSINERFGKNKLHYAAEDLGDRWQPKQHLRSPRYVSQWAELPRLGLGTLKT